MKDMEKLCKIIDEELNKIAEKGLNTGNLETAYKLVDMYKDLKNTEYWEIKSEYYMSVIEEMGGGYSQNDGYSMEDGYSQRRGQKRDSRGRYSRESRTNSLSGGNSYESGESYARRGGRRGYSNDRGYSENYSMDGGGYSMNYDRYMDSKQSYRSNKTPDCKQRLMQTLEDYMEEFSAQMEEMMRDSDCQEERATIKRYLDKIKNIA